MKKKSYANCELCPLYSQKRVIGETNCGTDLSSVSLLVLAEAPSHEEISQNRPLVGPSGKIFRKAFEESGLCNIPHYISNVVLCSNISDDGKTHNPPQEAIDICKINMDRLIEKTNPDMILIMGSTPMKVMDIAQNGILKLNGTIHKYNDHDVFLICHPSYVLRNGGIESETGLMFRKLFNTLYCILENKKCKDFTTNQSEDKNQTSKETQSKEREIEIIENLDKPYTFKLPSWCYSKDVCLIDIQNIKATGTILYIFKDKNGKKIYYNEPSNKKYYYIGKENNLADAPMLTHINNVHLVKTNIYKKEENEKSSYEYDVRAELKRSIDYYIERNDVPECDVQLKKLYFDIEVYSAGVKEFPDPRKAPSPINAISFQVNDEPTNVWMCKLKGMDDSKLNFKTEHETVVKIFNTERELLDSFFQEVKSIEPDVISGWNCIREDQNVWLSNEIVKIKDIVENDVLYNNDAVKKIKYSGKKQTYIITLSSGLKIYTSGDHIFPYSDNLSTHVDSINATPDSFESSSVLELEKKLKTKKLYLLTKKKINKNKNLKLETVINDSLSLYESIPSLKIHSFSLAPQHVKYICLKIDDTTYDNIDINKNISIEAVKQLGETFSDSTIEDNLDISKILDRARSKLVHEDFAHFVLLLYAFYKINHNCIDINLNMFSKLSNFQFITFLSSIILNTNNEDIVNTNTTVTISTKTPETCNALCELLLWNDISSHYIKNNINIELSDELITHIKSTTKTGPTGTLETKDIFSRGFKFDKIIFSEIRSIEKTQEYSNMYDIESGSHFFIANGIFTHNCDKFDIPTIFNRAKLYDIDVNKISPVDITYSNPNVFGQTEIFGLYISDMLELYKKLVQGVEESYKLDYIAQKVLGKGKVAYEGTLDTLYESDINKFVEYSGVDTLRLRELDVELEHTDLRFEMVKMCSSTWKAGSTTMGQIDPLCISYAKKMNMVCRSSLNILEKNEETEEVPESIPGGYVKIPTPGLRKYIIDLDFTALYPSIICTYNIGPNTYIGKIDGTLAKAIIYYKNRIDRDMKIEYIENPIMKNYKTLTMTCGELIDKIEKNKYIVTISGCIYKNHDEEMSFFYRIVQYILTSRAQYKDEMKKAHIEGNIVKSKQMKNKQMAYKILANSLYGVLANVNYRMFNNDMASTITLSGREAIKFVGLHLNNYLENNSLNIDPSFLDDYENIPLRYLIYTDTDSVFISLGEYLNHTGAINL
jgi:uracil-DNA glycosylase family 4